MVYVAMDGNSTCILGDPTPFVRNSVTVPTAIHCIYSHLLVIASYRGFLNVLIRSTSLSACYSSFTVTLPKIVAIYRPTY